VSRRPRVSRGGGTGGSPRETSAISRSGHSGRRGRVVAISSHPRESISSARPDDLFLVSSLARHVYTSLSPGPRPLPSFRPLVSTFDPCTRLSSSFSSSGWTILRLYGTRRLASVVYVCGCARARGRVRVYVCVCAPRALLRGCVGRVSSGESAGQNGRG